VKDLKECFVHRRDKEKFISQKLIVLISDQRLYESFVTSGLLDFTFDYDVTIFVPDNCTKLISEDLIKRKFIVIDRRVKDSWKNPILINLMTFVYRKRSKSFETRIRRLAGLPPHKKISIYNLLLVRKFQFVLIKMISYFTLFKLPEKIIREWACKNKIIKNYFRLFRPSHLMIISGGSFSNIENIFLHYAHKNRCKTGLIVDNWDNLSSKSVFAYKPNIVGVWGNSMKLDAETIHDFGSSSTRIIGSSRVNRRHKEVLGLALKPQILFAGSARKYFDELELLKYTMTLAAKYSLKVIYRPHPATYVGDLEVFNSSALASMSIVNIEPSHGARDGNPKMDSANALTSLVTSIKESLFVVASHSTVIVESLYFGKRVLSYSTLESHDVWGEFVWDSYTHLLELKTHPFIYHAHNLEQFERQFLHIFDNAQNRQEIINQIPEILPTFDGDYKERLLNFVNELLDMK